MPGQRTTTIGITLLVVFLILSLLANIFLLRQLRLEYARRIASQVWPAGAPSDIETRPAGVSGAPTVLLLGDSRIAEWGTPSVPGWTVANAGVRGITAAQLALRVSSILSRVRPETVVIQAGINDLKLLGPEPRLYEDVVTTCTSNISFIVGECRRHDTHVIVLPIWPVADVDLARRVVWSSSVAPGIDETNRRLKQALAGLPNVIFTNLLRAPSNEISIAQARHLYRDTLHLKPESYIQLTTSLGAILASNQTAEPTTVRGRE